MKKIFLFLTILSSLLALASCKPQEVITDDTIYVETISLNEQELTLIVGSEYQMEAEVFPENAEYEELVWSVSDKDVAIIDEFGKVKALAVGEAILLAEAGDRTENCILRVIDTPLESIAVDKEEAELAIGEHLKLNVTAAPEDAETGRLLWLTSDRSVATVDQDGNVSALKKGTVTITVKAGTMTAECRLTVVGIRPEGIKLDCSELEVVVGQTYQFTATVTPEDAEYEPIQWTSSDESVLTVDVQGLAKGIKTGSATVTAEIGSIKATCSVAVKEMGEIQVGDYFYSDGSVSTKLDQSKTPIGVVFWVGDPTKDDPTLKKDHPECTHGLVVALEDGIFQWQDTKTIVIPVGEWVSKNRPEYISPMADYEEKYGQPYYFNMILGYNNTKAIEEFNANSAPEVQPVSFVVEYRNKVKAPENTSDWYIPSGKEMALLGCGNFDDDTYYDNHDLGNEVYNLVNQRIQRISPQLLISGNPHWSSTEYDLYEAFELSYSYGVDCYRMSKSMPMTVRPVLAF